MDTTEQNDLPSNRADFSDCNTLDEKLEKHEQNIKETIDRAQQGDLINLSDLMADVEQLHAEADDAEADAAEKLYEALEDADIETEMVLAPVVVAERDVEGAAQ